MSAFFDDKRHANACRFLFYLPLSKPKAAASPLHAVCALKYNTAAAPEADRRLRLPELLHFAHIKNRSRQIR